MEKTKVSIIMPSLNVRPFIEECIESVLTQTLSDIEVICVDAGSTDGTLEILKDYKKRDSRVKVIISDRKSYGYQVNIGIDAAKGEYIGIVETDDYIKPDMYENLYAIASDSMVDYVKAGYVGFVHKDGVRLYMDNIKGDIDVEYGKVVNISKDKSIGMKDLNNIWSAIYSRAFLSKNNLRLNETPGASFQDTSFSVLVALLAESAVFLKEGYYCYRMDNAGSSVKSDSKITCIMDEYAYIEDELTKRYLYSDEVKRLVLNNKLYSYRWNYMRLSDESAKKFFDAIQKEMEVYTSNKYLLDDMSSEVQGIVKLLTDEDERKCAIEQEEERRNHLIELKEAISGGASQVIVGAGKYCDRIMFIEDAMGIDTIKAVCDNSTSIQGKKKGSYTVISVEEAVEKYPEANYIIAIKNKAVAKNITEQLTSLGVPADRTYVCGELPAVDEVMNMVQLL